MKKLLTLTMLLIILTSFSFSLDITKQYSATELNNSIDQLDDLYSEITVETLGVSYLNQPIKVLQLKNSETIYEKEKRYNKDVFHFLVFGGIHGRERLNPKLLLKQIEYYAENELVPKNMVIHYIPLGNPDGYSLSLLNGFETDFLKGIDDKNYSRWKSNIRGVDINRNFPDIYFDLMTLTWKDSWGRVDNKRFKSDVPSGEYYFGPYAGSEVETQILMNYMNRHKFEMFLDYHNQGEVLFVDKWFMSDEFNRKSLILANAIVDLNGYIIPKETGEYSSGFTTNYMTNRHRIPSITIETARTNNLPYLSDDEELKAYEENKDVTVEVFKKAIEQKNFGPYKTYDASGYFFDDYSNESIAKAYATKFNLEIKDYEGIPLEHLDDFMSGWAAQSIKELINLGLLSMDLSKGYQSDITVEDFLTSLEQINQERYLVYEEPDIIKALPEKEKIDRIQASYILYTFLDGDQYDLTPVNFEDIDNLLDEYNEAVYFVNGIGLINGYPDNNFRPRSKLSKEETAIILLRLFQLDNKGVLDNE